MSCYCCFVLLPLGPEKVMLYPCLFCVLRICELFGETISNMFGCVCYFVVECDGVAECGLLDRPCIVFQIMCVLCILSQ